MRISFVSLFPEAVLGAVRHSMLMRAEAAGIVRFDAINPRDFANDSHRTVDDAPFGGGAGMVMKPDVVSAAIEAAKTMADCEIIFTDPAGELFKQMHAKELASSKEIIFVCGHYEGIDERAAQRHATRRFSIGDFVLTGGELPAAVMADAIVRLLPGVLGDPESLEQDAFADGLLTHPQYTRPQDWEGQRVPEVLLGGNHEAIARWRRAYRLQLTRKLRPDLLARAPLSKDDLKLLQLPFPGEMDV